MSNNKALTDKSYKVEKIIRTIVRSSKVYYDVKWVGYKELTEEPENNDDIVKLAQRLWRRMLMGKGEDDSSSQSSSQSEQRIKAPSKNKKIKKATTKKQKMRRENGISSSAEKSIHEVDNSHQEVIDQYNISSEEDVYVADQAKFELPRKD